jgi:hypothetical protein
VCVCVFVGVGGGKGAASAELYVWYLRSPYTNEVKESKSVKREPNSQKCEFPDSFDVADTKAPKDHANTYKSKKKERRCGQMCGAVAGRYWHHRQRCKSS